jgi:hypothetical protein
MAARPYGPAAQADQGNPMFDSVFVNPAAYRVFMETGRWPDKTMFMLEIRRAKVGVLWFPSRRKGNSFARHVCV